MDPVQGSTLGFHWQGCLAVPVLLNPLLSFKYEQFAACARSRGFARAPATNAMAAMPHRWHWKSLSFQCHACCLDGWHNAVHGWTYAGQHRQGVSCKGLAPSQPQVRSQSALRRPPLRHFTKCAPPQVTPWMGLVPPTAMCSRCSSNPTRSHCRCVWPHGVCTGAVKEAQSSGKRHENMRACRRRFNSAALLVGQAGAQKDVCAGTRAGNVERCNNHARQRPRCPARWRTPLAAKRWSAPTSRPASLLPDSYLCETHLCELFTCGSREAVCTYFPC